MALLSNAFYNENCVVLKNDLNENINWYGGTLHISHILCRTYLAQTPFLMIKISTMVRNAKEFIRGLISDSLSL